MQRPLLSVFLLSATATLAIAHLSALNFHLYWVFPWLDIPMHLLGGVILGLFVFLIPVFYNRLPERYYSLPAILVFVLIVGLLWEWFEIVIGLPVIEGNFEIDMFTDLAMDLMGGSVGYFIGIRIQSL